MLDHPQPATPVKTDNSTAHNFVHNNMKQKKSKSWDMRFNWSRDKELHKTIKIFWRKGTENEADYSTKHFPPDYQKKMRERYFLTENLKTCNHIFKLKHGLQGCVKGMISHPRQTDRD